MNMRHTFKISPLAVIHGGEGAAGDWKVPETTRTILCRGDRLIFIEPHPDVEKTFQNCVAGYSILMAGLVIWKTLIFQFPIYLEPNFQLSIYQVTIDPWFQMYRDLEHEGKVTHPGFFSILYIYIYVYVYFLSTSESGYCLSVFPRWTTKLTQIFKNNRVFWSVRSR